MIVNSTFLEALNAPVRQLSVMASIKNGTITDYLLDSSSELISVSIDKVGDETKFFGYGVCQKINIKVIDKKKEMNITTSHYIEISFSYKKGVDTYSTGAIKPNFYISEVHRNENTGELSITAYDAIGAANNYTVNDFIYDISSYNTLGKLATGCITELFVNGYRLVNIPSSEFSAAYNGGFNLDGTETVRQVLDAIAEATQSIYYVNRDNYLVFKRLDKDGEAVLNIDKEKYFTLDSKTNRRLTKIVHTTELGDNVSATTGVSGSTQYIRDNPILELQENIATLVDNAITAVGGLTINQFNCEWRGNPLLEIGDKISLTTKDDTLVYAYFLNDTLTYDGALRQKTEWSYTNPETETGENPSTLGEAIKKTYARVDKANKEIALVASEAASNAENISSLMLNTESIAATVAEMKQETIDSLGAINGELATISNSVAASITAEDVRIQVQSELSNGVEKVRTETGFTFDSDGLTVSKSGSEMETQITEDGMTVSKNSEVVLVANNVGVDAVNLHATTYLIVGENSRFEDYGNRTGCFWIGG